MALLDMARFNSGLKILFPQKTITQALANEQPLWTWLPKKTTFFGRKAEIPINYGPPSANSHKFATAQKNKKGGRYTHFEVTRKRDYILMSLDRETMEASENDVGGYISAKKIEIKGAFKKIGQQLGSDLLGNGGGAIGRVTAVPVGNAIIVREQDISHFELDSVHVFSVTSDGLSGAPIGGGDGTTAVVTLVNFDTNTVTYDALPVGVTTNSYVFPEGNFGTSISGMDGWIPSVRPITATPFNAVDRSVFPSRLGGIYFDASSYGITEGIERAFARAAKESCLPETLWVNYKRFADISLDLGAKVQRDKVKVGSFAFDTISFHAGGRVVKIMADQNLADTESLALTRESWKFYSLKEAPRFLNPVGKGDAIIEPTADGVELRIGWNGELVCDAPRDNMRILLPT